MSKVTLVVELDGVYETNRVSFPLVRKSVNAPSFVFPLDLNFLCQPAKKHICPSLLPGMATRSRNTAGVLQFPLNYLPFWRRGGGGLITSGAVCKSPSSAAPYAHTRGLMTTKSHIYDPSACIIFPLEARCRVASRVSSPAAGGGGGG